MTYELVYRVGLGNAQSPFRVAAQPGAREVEWINRFLDQCAVRSLAWHTLRGYAFSLTNFIRWWARPRNGQCRTSLWILAVGFQREVVMRSRKLLGIYIATLAVSIVAPPLQAQPPRKQTTISVRGSAPLRQIADRLRHQYDWQINYEEPPWESPADLTPAPGFRGKNGGPLLHVAGRPVNLEFDEPGNARDVAEQRRTMGSVFAQYQRSGNSPFFVVRDEGRYTSIVPSALVRSNGKIVEYQPLARPSRWCWPKSAGDVLIRAFEDQNGARMRLQMGVTLGYSWSLNYEANEKAFYFNCIVHTKRIGATGPGNSSRLP